jgi:hypothetical protein
VINVPTVTPPPQQSGVFGSGEGWVSDWFESTYLPQTLANLFQSQEITQSGLTVFLVYDICEADGPGQGGCQHWGNHKDTVFGGATPQNPPQIVFSLWADYNDKSSEIFTDVAVLSHEVAESADDPYNSNSVYCNNGFMEVGDPLAWLTSSYVDYGGYTLQDLVFLTYFGASGVSIGYPNQFSFLNTDENLSICSKGP